MGLIHVLVLCLFSLGIYGACWIAKRYFLIIIQIDTGTKISFQLSHQFVDCTSILYAWSHKEICHSL